MDINRGVATHDQAVSILREYQRRRDEGRAFAEWFSIDPPFPDGVFGDDRLVGGAYCNGGIMPLVGGELARAAFDHGFEAYGVDVLRRYFDLVSRTGKTYLWYFPDGTPGSVETSTSPEALPTDGWGSSAMLWALTEGLAGVVDRGRAFDRAEVSPRWLAAGVEEAEVEVGYECAGRGIGYQFRAAGDRIVLEVCAAGSDIDFHILLPPGADARSVTSGGREMAFRTVMVEASRYADFSCRVDADTCFEIALR
jgi:hypothetical protein